MKDDAMTPMPADHPAVKTGRVGVLLVNLGTPQAATAPAVRTYLAQFLSDPRVIEIPKLAWLPILHGIILRTRPAKSAHAYAQVWTDQGSPLAAITRAQAQALQARHAVSAVGAHGAVTMWPAPHALQLRQTAGAVRPGASHGWCRYCCAGQELAKAGADQGGDWSKMGPVKNGIDQN